jgi:hypothetical protein
MRILSVIISFLLAAILFEAVAVTARAETAPGILEQSMSDTLDLWREGRYEQLYERLAHRDKTSKEQFVRKCVIRRFGRPVVFRSWKTSGC